MPKSTRLFKRIVSGLAAAAIFAANALSGLPLTAFADGEAVHKFEAFELTFVSGAKTGNEYNSDEKYINAGLPQYTGDDLTNEIWKAETYHEGHSFIYNLHVSTSGQDSIKAGDLQIKIPLHILKNKEGKYADSIELSVPSEEVYNSTPDGTNISNIYLTYKIVTEGEKEYAVLTNVQDIPSGFVMDIPFSYKTTQQSSEYMDMGVSDDCFAKGTIKSHAANSTEEIEVSGSSVSIPVYIDTGAQIKSTSKSFDSKSYEWDPNWGTNPDSSDDGKRYVYFKWKIESTVYDPYAEQFNSGEVTQAFDYSVTDTFTGLMSANDADGNPVTVPNSGNVIVATSINNRNWTVLSGDSAAADFATRTGLTQSSLSGNKLTYFVITRYPKESVDQDGVTYTFQNDETATVKPADNKDDITTAISNDGVYLYNPPVYQPPVDRADMDKFGLFGSRDQKVTGEQISSYALETLKEGGVIKGLRYLVDAEAYEYGNTVQEGYTLTKTDKDVEYYGKKNFTYTLTDNELKIGSTALTSGDYNFTALESELTIKPAKYSSSAKEYTAREFTDEEKENKTLSAIVDYYVTTNGSDRIKVASYDVKNKCWIDSETNTDYVSSVSGNKITFSTDNIIGYELESSNPFFYTAFKVTPTVTLRGTEKVVAAVGDADKIKLDNTARFLDLADTGTVNIREIEKHSEITKKFVPADENDIMNGQYKANWEVNIREWELTESGSESNIKQYGGTFYDILPIVSVTKADLIEVYADGVQLAKGTSADDGDYYIDMSETRKDSAGYDRVMLKVIISDSAPAYVYTLKVRTIHTHDDIQDYGRNVINSVAYETGNDSIADGYPDDGGDYQKINEKYLLNDLDPETDAKRFIYAQASHHIPALLFNSSGITKMVSSALTMPPQSKALVNQDSDYTYTIRLKNASNTYSKDIVILDSIENFFDHYIENGEIKDSIKNGAKAYDLTQWWKGTLVDFGYGNLNYKGIDYKVYVTTEKNPDLETYRTELEDKAFGDDFATSKNWVLYDNYTGDKAAITAFMIDLRKTTDDKDFVLGKGESLNFTLTMHSPKSEPEKVGYDSSGNVVIETYNNIYNHFYTFTEYDESGNPKTDNAKFNYVHEDYTTVSYRLTGGFTLKKVDSEYANIIVPGARFRLTGTSDYGTAVSRNYVTGKNGTISFTGLERGTYYLEEVYAPEDYQLTDEIVKIKIGADGNAYINDSTEPLGSDAFVITNDYRVHGDLSFMKTDDKGSAVSGAEFTLSGKSDYGNQITMTAVSSSSGVLFENIELGTYKLRETSFPEGIAPIVKEYTVTVKASGRNAIVTLEDPDKTVSGVDYIYNKPYTDFYIRKVDNVNETDYLYNAKYTLEPDSATAAKIDSSALDSSVWSGGVQTQYSGAGGFAHFTGLVPGGKYVLTEVTAPANHKKITDEYKLIYNVSVDGEGKVTVTKADETSYSYTPTEQDFTDNDGNKLYSYWQLDNERTYDGEVTLVKKWVGKPDTTGTPIFPEITLSTKEVRREDKYVTIDRDLFQKNFPAETVTFVREDVLKYPTKDKLPTGYVSVKDSNGTKGGADYTSDEKEAIAAETGDIYMWQDGTTVHLWTDANVVYLPKDCSSLFYDRRKLSGNLDLRLFSGKRVTTMASMFENCAREASSTLSIDMSNTMTTALLTNCYRMFFKGFKISSIRLSKDFNTQNVANMSQMFSNAQSLQILEGLEYFDTSNVKTFSGFFGDNYSLTTIDLSSFTTENASDISQMFYKMSSLKTVYVNPLEWNSTSFSNIHQTFFNTSQL